jgi:hypothetical protein
MFLNGSGDIAVTPPSTPCMLLKVNAGVPQFGIRGERRIYLRSLDIGKITDRILFIFRSVCKSVINALSSITSANLKSG